MVVRSSLPSAVLGRTVTGADALVGAVGEASVRLPASAG